MMSFTDFAQVLFPFPFVGKRIGVGAPQFFDHFALWHKGAFGFGVFVGVVELSQGELGTSHEGWFIGTGKLGIQFMGGVIELAPAFGHGFSPQSGLGIEPG